MTTTCEVYQGEDCGAPAAVTFRWTFQDAPHTLHSCDDHYPAALGDLLLTRIAPWITFEKVAA